MFCDLSQNNQHLLDASLKLFKELKIALKKISQAVFKSWIETVKMLFGSKLKNCLAYLNFDTNF